MDNSYNLVLRSIYHELKYIKLLEPAVFESANVTLVSDIVLLFGEAECGAMDLNTDIPTIKSEPVTYKEDGREMLHTEMAIEYSDSTDDYLAGYYDYNQPTGR